MWHWDGPFATGMAEGTSMSSLFLVSHLDPENSEYLRPHDHRVQMMLSIQETLLTLTHKLMFWIHSMNESGRPPKSLPELGWAPTTTFPRCWNSTRGLKTGILPSALPWLHHVGSLPTNAAVPTSPDVPGETRLPQPLWERWRKNWWAIVS